MPEPQQVVIDPGCLFWLFVRIGDADRIYPCFLLDDTGHFEGITSDEIRSLAVHRVGLNIVEMVVTDIEADPFEPFRFRVPVPSMFPYD